MGILVGSARTDENGEDHSGKAGDQTGHEVETQEWYLHPLGWVLIRPKRQDVANYIAQDVQYACDNDNVGYDQWNSNSLYIAAKPHGFDISKVTVPCETHCAALIRVGAAYAGVKCDIQSLIDCPAFYTVTEAAILKGTGQFDIIYDSKYTEHWEYLRRGDILVTPTQGHTVCVLQDGPLAYEGEKTEEFDVPISYITTGNVWLREAPSSSSPKAINYAILKNTVVTVDGTFGNWAHCRYGDHVGYISLRYAKPIEIRYKATGNLWLRKSAGTLSLPVTLIHKGEYVVGTGEEKEVAGRPWYEVSYNGKAGWASSKYLERWV